MVKHMKKILITLCAVLALTLGSAAYVQAQSDVMMTLELREIAEVDNGFRVTGTTQPGNTIIITSGEETFAGRADEDGVWKVTIDKDDNESRDLVVVIVNEAGLTTVPMHFNIAEDLEGRVEIEDPDESESRNDQVSLESEENNNSRLAMVRAGTVF